MILPIYNGFHPVLRNKTKEITNIDQTIIELVENMFETMDYAEGIGLAANQVGQPLSLLVVNDIYQDGKLIFKKKAYINPVVINFSEETDVFNEGCLSLPELREDVVRPSSIEIKYFDIDAIEHIEEVDGLLARVLQHEIDHLNGILFFERVSPIKRTLLQNKIKKIKNGIVIPDYPFVQPNGILVTETK